MKKNIRRLVTVTLCVCMLLILPLQVSAQQPATPVEVTYPIYGGWNDYDTYAPGWTAGSDNVVWNFGNKDMVYRQLKSLSLRYNPGGEFHMTTSTPFILRPYKWLSFTGRAEKSGLDFSITFTDTNNIPIGTALKFSDHGGKPTKDYWTQYNFPITDFLIPTASVGGIRIAQSSEEWGAELYLDEIYLSTERGEDINPALPTPNPSQPKHEDSKHRKYPPDTNPFVFIIPAIFAIILVLFH